MGQNYIFYCKAWIAQTFLNWQSLEFKLRIAKISLQVIREQNFEFEQKLLLGLYVQYFETKFK